jgi:hypothetical protein
MKVTRTPTLGRRAAAKLMLASPAAAALPASAAEPPPSADLGAFLAGNEPGLSADERAQVQKAVAGLQKTIDTVRSFRIDPDVAPALHFRPLRSPRR